MLHIDQPVNCPNHGFKTLQELVHGFGKQDPASSGRSCTGCPKLVMVGGMMTCKYLHDSMAIGSPEGEV